MDYALIMAGGSGTRLWPLSRENRPKQALKLVGEATMFQQAVGRLDPLFSMDCIFVVTRLEHVEMLANQVRGEPDAARQPDRLVMNFEHSQLPRRNFIVEPQGRGTAPAIGLAALHLRRRDPDATMTVLTADHYIRDAATFRRALAVGLDAARQGSLVTLGIKPTSPSTGYGYIEAGEQVGSADNLAIYRALRFTEKPDRQTAAEMVASGRFSWNSGMFIWRIDRILDEFARQMPAFYAQLQELDAALDTPDYEVTLARIWPQVSKQTIDYGVMEHARDVVVIPVEMGWSDVGSWASLVDLLAADAAGNVQTGEHILVDTYNSLVFGTGRPVALIGVHDLIVVDAEDAVLVCHKDQEQRVRELVEGLKAQGRYHLV